MLPALLLGMACALWPGSLAAMPDTLQLDDPRREYRLGGHAELFEDRQSAVIEELGSGAGLAQVEGSAEFAPMGADRVNVGVTNHARWMRLRLQSRHDTRWALLFDRPAPMAVDLYVAGGADGPVARDGQRVVTGKRPGRAVYVELPLQPGQARTFYVRVVGRPLLLSPRIVSMQTLYREQYDENLVLGLYYGIALAMLLYNLFLGAVLRERVYLFYATSVGLVVLVLLAHDGLVREYLLDPDNPRGPTTHGLILTAMVLSVIAFTRELLDTRLRSPRLDRGLRAVMIGAAVVSALAVGAFFEHGLVTLSVPGSGLVLLVGMALVLAAGVASMLAGYRPAVYFTLASSLLLTAWVIAAMRGLGVLDAGPWLDHAVRIGSVADMLLWSLALADRIRVLRAEAADAQARALDAERDVARARQQRLAAVIETQDAERRRIASDLHDSIGQLMLALKNRLVMARTLRPPDGDELEPLIELAQQGIDETRAISHNLHPHQLERLGLARSVVTAVDGLAQSIEPTLLAEVDESVDRLPRERRLHTFRIVQECLSNAIRHADAKRIDLFMAMGDDGLEIIVEDDGIGLPDGDARPERQGQGLANLRERVAILGGELQITSSAGEGTRIDIQVPLP